ncbi:DNA primase [subsurface metagenome]
MALRKGKDPDEIVRKEGKEAFQKLITKAEHFIDFKLRFLLSKYDLNNSVEKAEVVKEMSRTIAEVKDLTERQIWLNTISKRLSVDESILVGYRKKTKSKEQFIPVVLSLKKICYDLVTLLAMKPERYEEVVGIFEEEQLLDDITKRILTYIGEKITEGKEIDVADVINLIEDGEERKRVSATVFNIKEDFDKDDFQKMLNQYIERIKAVKLREKWVKIKKEIQKKERNGEAVRALLQEQRKIASILKTLGGNFGSEERV